MTQRTFMAAIFLSISALGVATAQLQGVVESSATIQEIDSPAGPGSGQPNLFTSPDGRTYLSWIEPARGKRHALRFSVLEGMTWSSPRTIAEGDNWFVNWADFPSVVALAGGTLAAHWLVKSGPGTYAYDVNIAISLDGGQTWGKPLVPHHDNKKTEHGFVTLLPWHQGGVAVIWLDGREMNEAAHNGHGSGSGAMTLRFTTITRQGQRSEDVLLDSRVCECCQTSAAATADGAVAVYRDRSEDETRDISIVRFSRGRWSEPRVLSRDGWEIHGCPVNGPAAAAEGSRVAVAWFTAANDQPQVKLILSKDSGASFGDPLRVDDGSPLGRVDLEMLKDGSALVSWLERTAEGGEIKLRRIRPDGTADDSLRVALTSAARASGFPRLVRTDGDVVLAWTGAGDPSKVRTATMKLTSKSKVR